MNPRYLAYCRAHGTTCPDTMLRMDRERWPGGVMTGFMLWMSEHWTEFETSHGYYGHDGNRPIWRYVNADAFDVWLDVKYPVLKDAM